MQQVTRWLRYTGLALLAGAQGAGAGQFGEYDCLIEPHAVVDVSTRDIGVLGELLVRRGDTIAKGQELARLESGVEEVAVEIARARAKMSSSVESKRAELAYLRAQQARLDELYEKKAVPLYEKEKAATDVILARAELHEARDNLELAKMEKLRAEEILARRTIRSLIDGVVVDVLVDPGESVEDRPIMTIAEVNPLNVEVILPVEMYGLIKVGTRAEVEPRIRDAGRLSSSVVVVDKVIDAASNTFGVRLELDNPGHAIPGGIRCDINFLTEMAGGEAQDGP